MTKNKIVAKTPIIDWYDYDKEIPADECDGKYFLVCYRVDCDAVITTAEWDSRMHTFFRTVTNLRLYTISSTICWSPLPIPISLIRSNSEGRLDQWPDGFCDSMDKILETLF